jgi:hypothetical protein
VRWLPQGGGPLTETELVDLDPEMLRCLVKVLHVALAMYLLLALLVKEVRHDSSRCRVLISFHLGCDLFRRLVIGSHTISVDLRASSKAV